MKKVALVILLIFVGCSSTKNLTKNDKHIIRTCGTGSYYLPKRESRIKLLYLDSQSILEKLIPPKLSISNDSLESKIIYPEIAKRAGVKGIIVLEFYVDTLGNVKDLSIVKGLGAGCDENVKNVFEKLKFAPAKYYNKKIKDKIRASIFFNLIK